MATSGQENDELGIINTNSVSSAVESVVSFDNTTGLQKGCQYHVLIKTGKDNYL
jgi:hypothetical protein